MRVRLIAGMLVTAALGMTILAPVASAQGAGQCQEMVAMVARMSPKKIEVDATELAKYPLGSPRNPVRAEMPYGERAYLAKLVCENGSRPTEIARLGSMEGNPDGHLLDAYTAKCAGKMTLIHMDMYHCGHVESRAVPGFRMQPVR